MMEGRQRSEKGKKTERPEERARAEELGSFIGSE